MSFLDYSALNLELNKFSVTLLIVKRKIFLLCMCPHSHANTGIL